MGAKEQLRSYAPDPAVSDETKLWAAANLADQGVIVKFATPKVKVRTETDQDGTLMRKAFRITVAPGHRDNFIIHLHKGASTADLQRARDFVALAKAGVYWEQLWERVEFASGFPGWIFRSFLADGEKYRRNKLRPCLDPDCIEDMHAWRDREQDEPCTADKLDTDGYGITVLNFHDGKGWVAYSCIDWELETERDLRFLDRLRNDFAYMLGEAKRLNALAVAA